MNKEKKFFKVYEIIDNTYEDMKVYPTYFVGAFVNKKQAIKLCNVIDIVYCNSTKIVYGGITSSDINDLKKYGLKAADKSALIVIEDMLKNQSQNQNDLQR